MDFMASWNCKHIANANIKRKIQEINSSFDIHTPEITTPEELYRTES
jgi:hypothetical protein